MKAEVLAGVVRSAVFAALLSPMGGTVAWAQTSRPASQPESLPASIRLEIASVVRDATSTMQRAATAKEVGSSYEIPNRDVEFQVQRVDGSRETVAARSDVEGRVTLDLGEVRTQSSVFVRLVGDGEPFLGSFSALPDPPESIWCYRISRDPSQLEQEVILAVREVQGADGRPRVKVRQISAARNRGFTAYLGPEGGPSLSFPLPSSAEAVEVTVDGTPIPEPRRQVFERAPAGVGIDRVFFNATVRQGQQAMINGSYQLDVPVDEAFDLDFVAQFPTVRLTLAVEEGRIHYMPDEHDPLVRLNSGGQQPRFFGMDKPVLIWSMDRLQAGSTIPIRLHYGRRPVSSRTMLITGLILGGLLVAVGLGLLAGRSTRRAASPARSATGVRDDDAKRRLDERFAAGLIDVQAYREACAALGADAPARSGSPSSTAPEAARVTASSTADDDEELGALAGRLDAVRENLESLPGGGGDWAEEVARVASALREHRSRQS